MIFSSSIYSYSISLFTDQPWLNGDVLSPTKPKVALAHISQQEGQSIHQPKGAWPRVLLNFWGSYIWQYNLTHNNQIWHNSGNNNSNQFLQHHMVTTSEMYLGKGYIFRVDHAPDQKAGPKFWGISKYAHMARQGKQILHNDQAMAVDCFMIYAMTLTLWVESKQP